MASNYDIFKSEINSALNDPSVSSTLGFSLNPKNPHEARLSWYSNYPDDDINLNDESTLLNTALLTLGKNYYPLNKIQKWVNDRNGEIKRTHQIAEEFRLWKKDNPVISKIAETLSKAGDYINDEVLLNEGNKRAELYNKAGDDYMKLWKIKTPSPLSHIANFTMRGLGGNYTKDLAEEFLINLIYHDFYDGKFHINPSNPFTNRVINNYHNYLRAYTLLDYTGFKPSTIGKGNYIGTKWESFPAFKGNFYGDTLYLYSDIKPYFLKTPIPPTQISKDEVVSNSEYEDINNTYDARWHGYSTNPKLGTIRFEDVFDIDPDKAFKYSPILLKIVEGINHNSIPMIINLEVPVVFTNDSSKVKFPKLGEYIKRDANK